MAISTNGAIITRVTSALYGEYLSNASYTEVSSTAPATLAASFLSNDFAGKTDLQIATTMLTNLGLTSITGLDNWLSAQLTAAGSTTAAKGAKIVSILNDYANLTADATYGTYATSFNAKVAAGLVKSQTTGASGGAYATADAVTASNSTFTLTTGTDTVTGGAGDDTINGNLGGTSGSSLTFSSSDAINGGAGTDTLSVEHNSAGGALNFGNVTNVEKLIVVETGAATTVALPNTGGYTSLQSVNSTYDVTFANIKSATVGVVASNLAATVDVTANYFSTTLLGTADNLSVTVESSGTSADPMALNVTGGTAANALETLTIANQGTASYVDVDVNEANTTKLVVNATEAITLTLADGTANTLKTIDASGSTAGVSVTAINSKTTITGGSGNDTLTGSSGNDTINAGAGNDSLVGSAGNDSLDAGAGTDTVSLDGSTVDENDIISGGEGTDTLKLTVAIGYTTTTNTDDGSGVTGFEKINLSGSVTQNMKALSGNTITGVTMATAGSVGSLTYASSAINAVTYSADSDLTISLAADGTADAMAITLAGGSTTSPSDVQVTFTDTDGYYDTLTVASNGNDDAADNTLGLDTAGATSLTITGTQNLNVTGTDVTALATVDASGWSGTTLTLDLSTSDAAITYTPGTGVQYVATGSGADVVTTGASSDSIVGNDGNDSITSAAGNDTVYGNDGKDTISAGDGNDSIYGGAGDDKIDAGAGNDSIDAGAGSDSVEAGAGADTITSGAGSDTLNGGAGNDTFVMSTSLSSGDVIDGGTDADTLEATISASSAPTITAVETFNLRGGWSATIDMTDVTGVTTVIGNTTASVTISEAPSTLASITYGSASAGDLNVSYASTSPALLTINLDSVNNGTTGEDITLTDVDAVKLAQLLTGVNISSTTSRTAYATTNHSVFDDIVANDTRTMTISVGSLTASTDVTGTELTFDDVTANALESLTISAGGYVTLDGNDITSSSASLTTVSIAASSYGSIDVGTLSATSASSMDSVSVTAGDVGTTVVDAMNFGSATIDAMTLSTGIAGTLTIDEGSTTVAGIVAGTISALTLDLGAASSFTIDAATTTGYNINASVGDATISFGASVVEDLSFGSSTATFGDFTLSGSSTAGSASTFTFDGTTMDSFTASSFGGKLIFIGSGMTGDIDSITGTNSDDDITGGAGADVINGGAGSDTLTGMAGADSIAAGAGTDVIEYTASSQTAGAITDATASNVLTADILTGLAAGDIIQLYTDAVVAAATTTVGTTLLTVTTAGGIKLVSGLYSSTTNKFTVGAADATNDDLLVQWADGTVVNSVVLSGDYFTTVSTIKLVGNATDDLLTLTAV